MSSTGQTGNRFLVHLATSVSLDDPTAGLTNRSVGAGQNLGSVIVGKSKSFLQFNI